MGTHELLRGLVTLEQLAALDLTLWFGSGAAAGLALHINQSTVSRHIQKVLRLLGLRLVRPWGSVQLRGDLSLLQAERWVHQMARFKGLCPLRVDGTYASGPWFLNQAPQGWMVGRFDLAGAHVPLQLLRDRVIDAWVGSYQPDLPRSDDPDWWVLDLVREPVHLLSAPDHPLAGESGISQGDLERFPSLALPSGWFPRTETILRAQGLWRSPVDLPRYDPSSWEGRCSDQVTLAYGQSLTELLQPGTVRLDWQLGLLTGEALVVRRDLMDQPAIQELSGLLQGKARKIAMRLADVEVAA